MIYEILQSAHRPSDSRWRLLFSLPISTFSALGVSHVMRSIYNFFRTYMQPVKKCKCTILTYLLFRYYNLLLQLQCSYVGNGWQQRRFHLYCFCLLYWCVHDLLGIAEFLFIFRTAVHINSFFALIILVWYIFYFRVTKYINIPITCITFNIINL